MIGMDLPDDNHVVRYVKPTHLRKKDGKATGAAFCLRADETGLSVNWLEYFHEYSKNEQLAEVRRLSWLNMNKNGRLAELHIATTKLCVRTELEEIGFIHSPRPEDDTHKADPSHCEITGLPLDNSPESEMIGDMIAKSVQTTYPTVGGIESDASDLEDA